MTIDAKQIKQDAEIAFENGDHSLAFQLLWQLENVDEFVAYVEKIINRKPTKKNWFAESDYFWTDFILQEECFVGLLGSESAIQLFHHYFKSYKKCVPPFELKAATEFPELFIKAIRVNQVFLDPERIERLKSLPINNNFSLHQKIWQKLFEDEKQQWKEIEIELDSVLKFLLEDILGYCIIWLETRRFHDSSQPLASVYSFFIDLILTNKSCKPILVKNSDEFFKHFLEVFKNTYKNEEIMENNNVFKILSKISNWINYRDTVISPYSFDLDIELIQENELFYFNSPPEADYKWFLDGFRYEVNQLNYFLQASDFVENLEETGLMIISGKSEYDIDLNRNLEINRRATLFMLDDLSCDTFILGKGKVKTEIDVYKLLCPLLTYSFNRLDRYENSLEKFFRSSKNWHEAFVELTLEAKETNIAKYPYFLMTESEYKELNQKGLSGLPKDSTTEVIQLFSWFPDNKNEFNRFKHKYEVELKPFMKIGNFLFCPILFFANNIWFYSFAQAALYQPTSKKETENMENRLAERFKEKGWKVKVINECESNEMDGDIDIFVEDNNDLLFIQLKRTYFRVTLREAYFETINRDTSAAKQLNKAEGFLKNKNEIYEMKHKPHKWIVSNSFENIGTVIDNCHKINYFDLLNALGKPEIKTVSGFIDELENDKNLQRNLEQIYQLEKEK